MVVHDRETNQGTTYLELFWDWVLGTIMLCNFQQLIINQVVCKLNGTCKIYAGLKQLT